MRARRGELGWSQAELARRVDVSRQTINALETGRYDPSLPLAFALADVFRCSIEDLFEPDQRVPEGQRAPGGRGPAGDRGAGQPVPPPAVRPRGGPALGHGLSCPRPPAPVRGHSFCLAKANCCCGPTSRVRARGRGGKGSRACCRRPAELKSSSILAPSPPPDGPQR